MTTRDLGLGKKRRSRRHTQSGRDDNDTGGAEGGSLHHKRDEVSASAVTLEQEFMIVARSAERQSLTKSLGGKGKTLTNLLLRGPL